MRDFNIASEIMLNKSEKVTIINDICYMKVKIIDCFETRGFSLGGHGRKRASC